MRIAIALLAGAIFGLGLTISDMVDPARVLAFLDVAGGAWDPTLAFVMGGAIVPMAVAWRFTRRGAPLAGGSYPAPPDPVLDRRLVVGSILFGMGWGLAGLCPGPSIASLSYGGSGGLVFLAAMIAGMALAPAVGRALGGVRA